MNALYLDYRDTEECHRILLEQDLFVDEEPMRGKVLKEAYGLCSCEDIGEIHEGDRIAIVNGHTFITTAKSWEKVKIDYFDFS